MLKQLDDNNINHEFLQIKSDKLKASQPFTISDDIQDVAVDENNPIWIDSDMNILDGHHKWVNALSNNQEIFCIKINLDFRDACRVLNKIQDIHEYEESRQLEEVEMQDAINYYNGDENQFLTSMDEQNIAIQEENPSKNEQTVVAYRKEPIKENSVIGNFFALKPIEGYDKYEIDFNNLLDTDALGIVLKDSQEPIEILSKIWFPNINFEELSRQYNISSVNLKNKAIAEKAMKMGYDGIKYGSTLIQGLK